jgi:phosphatidate cytidylyltransferase
MLRTKVITAAIGLPILLALIYLGGWPFWAVVGGFMLLGLGEFYVALRLKNIEPVKEAGFAGAIGIWAVTQWTHDPWRPNLITACTAGVVFMALIAQFWRRRGTSSIANAGATVFGVVYVALLFSFFLRLRMVPLSHVPGIEPGGVRDRMGALFIVLAPVWSMDTAANLIGGRFGTRKPWPTISPNKTYEGAAGGLLACLVVTLLVGAALGFPMPHMVALGLLQGVLGQLGDFCESLLKRDVGVKDFGTVLPGHGGVLDRIDSLLFALPVAYAYLTLWVIPPT